MKVRFKTFGCRLNRAESLALEAEFLERGWTLTETSADADLVVVRGCSVTRRAQAECENYLARLEREYPFKRVVATGCLPRRRNEYIIEGLRKPAAPVVPQRTGRAWLKAQDGCNARCSFCIVPRFRGNSVSVPFMEVVDSAKRFADAGYGEIVLTGCNLVQYSCDGKRLPELVASLAAVGGCRIRVGSLEPGAVALETIAAMAAAPAACRYLHFSVQSGSNRILAAMRRPYLASDVHEAAGAALKAMPGVSLGCDMIAGFPGETFNDHLASLSLLKSGGFSRAHVFPYSERPGTAAEAMGPVVRKEDRSARAHELAAVAGEQRLRYAARFRGKTVELAVEDAKTAAGWSSEYLWCKAADAHAALSMRAERRKLLRARVAKVAGDTLLCEPAGGEDA